jgi:hypothetical protein
MFSKSMKKLLFLLLFFTPLSMWAQHSAVFNCVFVGACEDDTAPPSVRVRVFPNPTTDFLTIEDAPTTEGVLFDAIGRRVRTFTISPKGFVDVSDLAQGIFVAVLRGGLSFKIIKI